MTDQTKADPNQVTVTGATLPELIGIHQEGYKLGFLAGLEAYAVWRDGEQWIGNHRLDNAKATVEETWNYNP